MTTKHTPGPWLFRGKSSSVHEQPKNEPGENYTYGKQIFRFRDDDDEVAGISDEDLALILAAPDLLGVLEELLPDLQCRCDVAFTSRGKHQSNTLCRHEDGVKAAIAKARRQ